MHILMVAHSISNWTPAFARSFMAAGHAVKVVSFSPQPVPGTEFEFVGVEPFDKYRNKHLFITRVPRVRRIIRQWRPDIVFAPYLASNGLTAALAGAQPLVLAAVGSDVFNPSGRRGLSLWLREASIRYTCRRAVLINSVSQALTRELMRLGAPRDKILEQPFGPDVETFRPDPEMPRPAVRRFICARRHEPLYDIPTIIRALAILKSAGRSFECLFTGSGTLWEDHRRLAADLGLGERVRFTGDVTTGELPALFGSADVYVSASTIDGTSVALLEGMASGLLPVVSRIEANLPWVEDGRNGLLFDCGDAEGLARALERAMEDRSLRERAFRENRSLVVERASMQAHHAGLLAAFERIAAAGRGGGVVAGPTAQR